MSLPEIKKKTLNYRYDKKLNQVKTEMNSAFVIVFIIIVNVAL